MRIIIMNIGIKNCLNTGTLQFYNQNYDILRTPNFDDETRLLKPQHGLNYLGNKKHKVCRFCGKEEPGVTFAKDAHAFPEAIGNKVLATYYECDECNDKFGRTIENEYCKYFDLYHSIMMESGKDGKRKCNFKVPCDKRQDDCAKHCIRIEFDGDTLAIGRCKEASDDYIKLSNYSITISKPVGNCCPIAVFKALVKMAITVMPEEEVGVFSHSIKWILEEEHKNFYKNHPLLIRYQMIPGFNVTKYPYFILYRRKRDVWNIPYMLFHLTYGCFSLMIEVAKDGDEDLERSSVFEDIPFAPHPFHISEEGIWDMSGLEMPKGTKHSVLLNFEKIEKLRNEDLTLQNGKWLLLR